MVLPVRRLVQHAIAGVGFSAFVATAAIASLTSPPNAGIANADPVMAVPVSSSGPTPDVSTALANAAARADQEADRSAARAKLAAAAAKQASRRAKTLAKHGKSVAAEEARLKAAKARAEAAAARARAAAAKAEAEREAARRRALANRGYQPGTTDPREMARQILSNKYGYGEEQYSCFNNIIMRESMWNVYATNPSSGAYGIPQALPGSKMASAGSDWRTNPATQIIWGIGYMRDRYGSPCQAWAFKSAHGWY
jgi:Transglycosylase SLT domain